MSTEENAMNDSGPTADPFATWTKLRDNWMQTWTKAMADVVNSEAYAEATGRMLDSYVGAGGPARKAVEAGMDGILAQLNMPSRTEVIGLSERLTNMEMRLDDIEAKLDKALGAARKPAQSK